MDSISLLTHLEHRNSWIDAHDLWSIRNQILHDLKYLASQGLYHKCLNLSNVLVCSLRPISIKLSLFSNSHVPIGFVNTEIPIQEFWKQKIIEHEEVCFDELIRSIIKSVFPYSIIDKNIVFANPNTLERSDLESLKALICSIEFETMFKSGQSEVADLSPLSLLVELKNLSLTKSKVFDLWPLKNLTKLSTLDLRETLILKENQQELTNSSEIKTLINSFEHGVFDLDFSNYKYIVCDLSLYCHCSASKSLNLSDIYVRNISEISKFPNLETLDLSNVKLGYNSYRQIVRITDISFLSTCIKLKSLSLDRSEVADLSPLSLLSNTLRSLSLNNSLFPNLCQLSNLKQLEFLSLNNNNITDICALSSLQNLTNLSLYNTKVSDLSSLQYLSKLSFLDVRKTLLSHEYHRRVSGLSCVQEFLNSFTVHRVDFSITNRKRTCSSELSLKKSR
ncbi:hypothetical protein RCL1_000663 [Eukaryota sp. TZLM3-RCL]